MKTQFQVTMDDGTELEVLATSRDVREWERTHNESYLTTVTSETQLAQLAHIALVRTGQTAYGWEEWERHCDDLNIVRLRPVVGNPTVPTPTDDSSAS